MIIINKEFEEAVNCMELSNSIKKELNDEDAVIVKKLLLAFYGKNVEGL